ncbi:hypothetical protein KCP73_04550 [Salmonella enterica subsp. enterica]|nr:hypothetical protein KCP73_04550 [Salmonella enterica subsp. enterica]
MLTLNSIPHNIPSGIPVYVALDAHGVAGAAEVAGDLYLPVSNWRRAGPVLILPPAVLSPISCAVRTDVPCTGDARWLDSGAVEYRAATISSKILGATYESARFNASQTLPDAEQAVSTCLRPLISVAIAGMPQQLSAILVSHSGLPLDFTGAAGRTTKTSRAWCRL